MGRISGSAVLHTRNAMQQPVPDTEPEPDTKFQLIAMERIRREMEGIRRKIADITRPVDEYVSQTLLGSSESFLEVLPQFDTLNERIESVIVTGPAGLVTVQVGDREWSLTIPASGILVIAPVSLLLARNDRRTVTSATPGNYGLELMGWADERY